MSLLRDILRRPLRSVLTIVGISVGVLALAVLGAISEKAGVMLERAAGSYVGKIVVAEEGAGGSFGWNFSTERPLSKTKVDAIRRFPGVADVAPEVQLVLDPEAVPLGTPKMILGGSLEADWDSADVEVAEGRLVRAGERGVVLIGPDLVEELDARVGGTVTLREEEYEVVGILERAHDLRDQSVMVPLPDAQAMLVRTLPPVFAAQVDTDTLYMGATVYAETGVDADDLARALNRGIKDIKATGPTELTESLGQWVAVIDAILASVASVALIVGGLSVVNTMMMSLAERRREIGLKRALGASRLRVARDVLAESALMGALGGVLGFLLAAVAVVALNEGGAAGGGVRMFLLTPRLAAGSLAFATLLGALAGAYPAWRVSRSDPVALLSSR